MKTVTRTFCGLFALCLAAPVVAETVVNIAYLRQEIDRPPVLSNLDAVPEDEGIAGAFVGLADNITTGKFLGQTFALDIRSVPVGGDLVATANEILASTDLILIDAPSADMTQIADLEAAQDALFFNVSNYDDALRDDECRANLLHTLPSYAMRSDALMQLLQSRRWTDLVMVSGTHEPDIAFANALRRSATKFGLRIRDEKEWVFDANMRRAASAEMHPIPAHLDAARGIPPVQRDGFWGGGNSLGNQTTWDMDPPSFRSRPLLHKEIAQAARHLTNPKVFQQAQGHRIDLLHIRSAQRLVLPSKPARGCGIYRQGLTAPLMSPRSATCCPRHNSPFD